MEGEECACGGLGECVRPALLRRFTAVIVGDAFACAKKGKGVRLTRMQNTVRKAFCVCMGSAICAVIARWEDIPASNAQRGAGRADMVDRFADQVEVAIGDPGEERKHSLSQDAPEGSPEKEAAEKAARAKFFSQPCQEIELALHRIAKGLGSFGEQRALNPDPDEVRGVDRRAHALRQACSGKLFACTVEGNKVLVTDGECQEKCFRAEASCLAGNRLTPDAGHKPEHFVIQPYSVNRAQVA
jgi:hypothetical protein